MTSQYRVNYHLRAHKRDSLIEFIKGMLLTPFVLHSQPNNNDKEEDAQRYSEIFLSLEELISEHRKFTEQGIPAYSRLSKLVPSIGTFFTSLPLQQAFERVNGHDKISARKHVPPSFNDIRRILNMAQLIAIAPQLKLVTFDGDMTLYADGMNFEEDTGLTAQIIALLRRQIYVAIVTAAGYGDDAPRYEHRLSGLLAGFAKAGLSASEAGRFFVLGGECNFLFKCTKESTTRFALQYISDADYSSSALRSWTDAQVQQLLDVAEAELRDCVGRMAIGADILRKPRAVGMVPRRPAQLTREQLDECALSAQLALLKFQGSSPKSQPCDMPIPFCAFNGGNDCWVDIGNKLIGVRILQDMLGSSPSATLHVGDQFLSTGNDLSTRTACCTCWIINPDETLRMLVELEAILNNI
ncbi:IMP 5'-nucleotidase [Coemansia aciculifera]|uniref:IMP 5'-nucleotidase n=1 Tax=Coemansia aciculifera TaxID=417176 RepID=A0ACC1M8Q7_9FUNG|nr:IMP 5'-nucleotidase [Coemansia aciculifera]KAJ2910933.1 IMP 5'-nucleotidase [Coemansia aciculifera]